jgi:hypothetical protein
MDIKKQFSNGFETVFLFSQYFSSMQYSIKDLDTQGISKNLVYEALKNGLPFSKEFIKNKRVFNETDLELFRFYKAH